MNMHMYSLDTDTRNFNNYRTLFARFSDVIVGAFVCDFET